jgi:hypothetical protein
MAPLGGSHGRWAFQVWQEFSGMLVMPAWPAAWRFTSLWATQHGATAASGARCRHRTIDPPQMGAAALH